MNPILILMLVGLSVGAILIVSADWIGDKVEWMAVDRPWLGNALVAAFIGAVGLSGAITGVCGVMWLLGA